MAQYKTGTISVTNGSPIVTGSGTNWLSAGINPSDFLIADGDAVAYLIASVDADNQITLNSNYAGTTRSGIAYTAHTDRYQSLPIFSDNDADTAELMNEVVKYLVNNTQAAAEALGRRAVFGDLFNDFVISGGLPTTSVNLSTDTPATEAYVSGLFVSAPEDTARAYTASVDTYVDLGQDGTFGYTEVPNGDPAPAIPADHVRLALVVTDADNITGVTDLRTLQAELRDSVSVTTATDTQTVREALDNRIGVFTSVSNAVDACNTGDVIVGTQIRTLGYRSAALVDATNTPVGGMVYRLLDAGSSGARPAADQGSIFHVSGGSGGLYLKALFPGDFVTPYHFGAYGDGSTVDNGPVSLAYQFCGTKNWPLYVQPGRYKGNFTFSGKTPVYCSGTKETVFVQDATGTATVKLTGSGVDAFRATLKNCTIDAEGSGAGVGLQCGEGLAESEFSNGLLESIVIQGFLIDWDLQNAIMGRFSDIYVLNGGTGIRMGAERTMQALEFTNVRVRLNDVGILAQSGHMVVWNNLNVESNDSTGLKIITGTTSGPTHWVFNGGNIEDDGRNPGATPASQIAGLYLDMNNAIAADKGMNIVFNGTLITSHPGAYDVSAMRAQYVRFNRCNFSRVADGGFTSSKFNFNAGTSAVRAELIQCGTLQDRPTPTMYSSFPALATGTNGPFGFFYEFESDGKVYSNRELSKKVISVHTSDVTSLDVRGVSTIVMDSAGGNITLFSLANGLDGQRIAVIKPTTANTVTIAHNGTGTEKIFGPDSIDVSLSTRQGADLVHYNGTWYFAHKS